jgi:hypothetical protein
MMKRLLSVLLCMAMMGQLVCNAGAIKRSANRWRKEKGRPLKTPFHVHIY